MKRYESATFDHTNAMGIMIGAIYWGFCALVVTLVALQFTWWGLFVFPAFIVWYVSVVWRHIMEDIGDEGP